MEKLKFALLSVVVLSALGLLGYWSVLTLQSGTDYVQEEKLRELQKENEDLKKEVESLTDELNALRPRDEEPASPAPEPVAAIYKYQDLIDELQKLEDGNVFLKEKSRGPAVGAVQKFLNIYNNTSSKVDNDYGANTAKAVANFQKASGLTAEGVAGPGTFRKMIEWLKEQ